MKAVLLLYPIAIIAYYYGPPKKRRRPCQSTHAKASQPGPQNAPRRAQCNAQGPPRPPPPREIGGMWPWGPSFGSLRGSSKVLRFRQKTVLFAVGTHRRGIRVRILITLPIGRAGARVVVWGVPHTPKMGSRRREIGNLLREYFRSCSTQKPRYQCYFAECITRSTNGRRPVRPSYLKLDLW